MRAVLETLRGSDPRVRIERTRAGDPRQVINRAAAGETCTHLLPLRIARWLAPHALLEFTAFLAGPLTVNRRRPCSTRTRGG